MNIAKLDNVEMIGLLYKLDIVPQFRENKKLVFSIIAFIVTLNYKLTKLVYIALVNNYLSCYLF